MKYPKIITGILLALFVIVSVNCSNNEAENEAQSAVTKDTLKAKLDPKRFPNEMSELALLMRNLIDDLKASKQIVSEGKKPNIDWMEKYGDLLNAKPTEEKNSGPVFHGFGAKFLQDLEDFQNADTTNQVEVYNGMIQSCIDCHQQHCQGPIPAIKKLWI